MKMEFKSAQSLPVNYDLKSYIFVYERIWNKTHLLAPELNTY